MNRKKLDALLAAGIITLQQHQAALSTINSAGIITELPQLELQVPASVRLDVESDQSEWDGILRGTVTGYGVLIPSHGMILEPGCLTPRQPLSANKMMRDHDHSQPVGYMLEVDAPGEEASFQIAPGERARVQQEVVDKLRDGLSVGFTALEYDIDDDWTFHVIAADWYETSLCAVPAVVGAGVTSVAAALATLRKENRTMNRAQLAAALAAGTITQEQHDTALATLDAFELANPAPRPDVTPDVAAGPQLQTQQPTPHVQTHDRQLSLDQVVTRMSEAARSGSVGGFQLAISDILPADDSGDAFTRPEWLDQVFTATDETRTWVNAIGTPELMTALDGKGWRWDEEPEVDEYDMDATEVPSNDISTEPVTYSGWGVAAGWGVARSLLDFAEEEFTRAFWERVGASYQKKTNIGTRTRVLAACRAPGAILASDGGTSSVATGDPVALIKQIVRDVRAIDGGKANRVFLGETEFGLLEDLPTDDLPLWLKSAVISLDIAEGTANVGQLVITHDAALGTNQGVGFDSRAFRIKEKKIPNLSAIAISHGKVDLGIYGYMRLDTHDPRLAVKRTAGEVLPTP